MTVMTRRLLVAIAGVLLLSAHVQVQSGDDARRPAGKQWPAVSGDWGNTRHSTLNQINTQNITKLGGAWTSQKFDTPGSSSHDAGGPRWSDVRDGAAVRLRARRKDRRAGSGDFRLVFKRAWARPRVKAWPSATGSCSSGSPTRV